jgi:hypothetical protein
MDRRSFLSNSLGGLSALLVGNAFSAFEFPYENANVKQVHSLSFRITEAQKEMITHNTINKAECFYWIFKEERFPADCPGPIIVAMEGDEIKIEIKNELNQDHAFYIQGVVSSGAIRSKQRKSFSFIAPEPGTYLYYDHLNAPVNRMMGLHGALVVMPRTTVPGNKFTPYKNPTPNIQRLFNDFGSSISPGLSWDEGDPATNTPPFRQYVWLLHEASPILFDEVGSYRGRGKNDYPAGKFLEAFTNDRYANTYKTGKFNKKPHFFTINGQSGFLAHHNPFITPFRRIGEPVLIRTLNAGLATHSLHIHANHIYLLAMNNKLQNNLLWLDTHEVEPLGTMDWALPMRRPPDIPNERGIGLADRPLRDVNGYYVWPPREELSSYFPDEGEPWSTRMSPLCYPMHDHIETSQTAQGANYTTGIMSGVNITGDRNTPGAMNFPNYPSHFDRAHLSETLPAAPEISQHLERSEG